MGAIRAEAAAGAQAEFLFFFCPLNNARFHRLPVGQISRNLHRLDGMGAWPRGHVTALDQSQRQHCVAKDVARVCPRIIIYILLFSALRASRFGPSSLAISTDNVVDALAPMQGALTTGLAIESWNNSLNYSRPCIATAISEDCSIFVVLFMAVLRSRCGHYIFVLSLLLYGRPA